MKNIFYFIILLSIGSIVYSCKTHPPKSTHVKPQPENVELLPDSVASQPKKLKSLPDHLAFPNEFVESQKTWLDFKESTDNTYKYRVADASWVGFSWETTITVEQGIIKERSFKYTSTKGLPEDIQADEREWIETENQIGTHKNGAAPLTLDEVYAKAEKEWLLKRGNTEIFFKTENNGMISTCGYILNNCADDCFRGITIENIEAI